jgi:hypothetical protein
MCTWETSALDELEALCVECHATLTVSDGTRLATGRWRRIAAARSPRSRSRVADDVDGRTA